jgi:hypothetical protein
MPWKDRIAQFRNDAFLKVNGPVAPGILDTLEFIQEVQDQHAIEGDIVEIGVLHGRFFLALDCFKREQEVSVAVDIFDDKHLNVDGSGMKSGLAIFEQNVQKFAQSADDVRVVKADSLALTAQELRAFARNKGFRLFSVDGGHTPEHVTSDLELAAAAIVGGGVVLLDDYYNPHWPGVHEGFVKHMLFAQRKLAPFGFHANKLLLTNPSYHRTYLDHYRRQMNSSGKYRTTQVTMSGFAAIVVQAPAAAAGRALGSGARAAAALDREA